jgi:hypothetical protein
MAPLTPIGAARRKITAAQTPVGLTGKGECDRGDDKSGAILKAMVEPTL